MLRKQRVFVCSVLLGFFLLIPGSSVAQQQLWAMSGNNIYNTNSGNVGIGTNNPTVTLAVQGDYGTVALYGFGLTGTSQTPTLGVFSSEGEPTAPASVLAGDRLLSLYNAGQYDTTPGHYISGASIDFYADENYASNRNGTDIRFLTAVNGSGAGRVERMRIDNTGNVGIGTTNPTTTLAIQGTNATAFLFGYGVTGTSDTPTLGTFASGGTPTAPTAVLSGDRLLSLYNFAQYDTTPGHGISGASIDFYADENYASNRNGTDMRFFTAVNGSGAGRLERMRIDNVGNVGLGTTTPGQKLEVNGSIKLSAGSGGSVIFPDGTSQTSAPNIRHGRTTSSCSTGNTQGNTCSVTVSWTGSAFSDTNYSVTCTPQSGVGSSFASAFVYVPVGSRTTSGVSVTIETLNSLSATLSGVDCIAVHD